MPKKNHKGLFGKIFSSNNVGTALGVFTAFDFSTVGALSLVAFLPTLLPYLMIKYTLKAAVGIGVASAISGFVVESQIYVGDIKHVFNLLFKDGFNWEKIKHNIRHELEKSLLKKDLLRELALKKVDILGDEQPTKFFDLQEKFNLANKELLSHDDLLNLEKAAFTQVMSKMFHKTFNYKAKAINEQHSGELHSWYRYQLQEVIKNRKIKKPNTKRKNTIIYEDEWQQIFDNFCKERPTEANAFITGALKDPKFNKLLRHQLAGNLIKHAEKKVAENSHLTLQSVLLKNPPNHTTKYEIYSFLLINVAPIVSFLAAVSFGAYSYIIFLSGFMYLGFIGLGAMCPPALIGIIVIVPTAMWWYRSLSNAITSDLHIKIKNSFAKIIRPKGYDKYNGFQLAAHYFFVFIGVSIVAVIFTMSVILSFCAAGVYLQQNIELAVSLGIKITQAILWINRVIFAPSILVANIIFALNHLLDFWKKIKIKEAIKDIFHGLKNTNWEKVGDAILEFATTPSRWIEIPILLIGVVFFTLVLTAVLLHFACEAAMSAIGKGNIHESVNRFVDRLVVLFNILTGTNFPSDLAKFVVKFFDEFFDDIDYFFENEVEELEHHEHDPDQLHNDNHDHNHDHGVVKNEANEFEHHDHDSDHSHDHGHHHGVPSYGEICNWLRKKASSLHNPEDKFPPVQYKEEGKQSIDYEPIFFRNRALPKLEDAQKVYFQHTSDFMRTPIAVLIPSQSR